MIISNNRKVMRCCDPRCYIKLGKMLSKCFRNFGIKNIGDATATGVVKDMQSILKYQLCAGGLAIFAISERWVPPTLYGAKGEIYYDALHQIFSKRYTLGELIKNLSIPALDTTAKRIFDVYTSTNMLKEAMEKYGTLNVLDNLGIHDRKVAYYIETYFEDMIEVEKLFKRNIKYVVGDTIDIVVTGSVAPEGMVMSRKEFVEYLNAISLDSNGLQLFNFNECTAVKTAPYIVADQPSGSRKYKEGLARGVLITSTELVSKVKEQVKLYEERGN